MSDALVNASLLWLVFFGAYVILGFILRAAPGIVLQTAQLQAQSAGFFKRLPLVAVGLWVILFVATLVFSFEPCRLC